MKIVFISEFFPPYVYGGAEVSTSLLVDGLRKTNDCTVITSQLASSEWIWNGVRIIPALQRHALGDKTVSDIVAYGMGSITRPLLNGMRLIKLLRTEPADIINFVASSYALLPTIVLVSLITKKSIVVDVRDFTSICVNDFSYQGYSEADTRHSCFSHVHTTHTHSLRFVKLFLPLFDVYEVALFQLYKLLFRQFVNHYPKVELISLSDYVRQKLVQNGFLGSKISVISNICHVDSQYRDNNPNKYDFAFAGRLEAAKGIWQVIHAYEQLHMPHVKFAVAGDGTQYEKIKEYISRRNMPNLELLGRLAPADVLSLYGSSKFIVAPVIRPEPFGRFIQESITTGTPVVATNVGGIPEGIVDGENGFLVPPDDTQALVDILRKAVTLPADVLLKMRLRTKKDMAKYSAATIIAARMRVYLKELNK